MATTTSAKTPPPLKGPGIAEIKPDNPPAIREGLYQLRAYLRQSEIARGTLKAGAAQRPAWINGIEPERTSVWLITYLPLPKKSANPAQLKIVAHELKRDELLKDRRHLPSLESLLISRHVLPLVALPPTMPFPSPDKADMFGLAVESIVREKFGLTYKRAVYRGRRPGLRGPDVLWRELQGLYRELAEETGDTYWREVADELSAGA